MNFGDQLKKIRQKKGITQEELAKRINISRSNIANYENNKNMPSIDILKKLSSVFEVSADYLLGNTTMENPKKEIENHLSKLNLTEEEYSLYIENAIKAQILHIPFVDTDNPNLSREDEIWTILFQVYEDYLHTGYLKRNIEMLTF